MYSWSASSATRLLFVTLFGIQGATPRSTSSVACAASKTFTPVTETPLIFVARSCKLVVSSLEYCTSPTGRYDYRMLICLFVFEHWGFVSGMLRSKHTSPIQTLKRKSSYLISSHVGRITAPSQNTLFQSRCHKVLTIYPNSCSLVSIVRVVLAVSLKRLWYSGMPIMRGVRVIETPYRSWLQAESERARSGQRRKRRGYRWWLIRLWERVNKPSSTNKTANVGVPITLSSYVGFRVTPVSLFYYR